MNKLPGKDYPISLGGQIAQPQGLLLAGDLTESGAQWQWEQFITLFGLNGHDGLLHYPVFENVGNHDYGHGSVIESRVISRHGGKRYSWNWGVAHFVSLADGPDDDAIRWLGRDLETTGKGAPIVVFLHYPLRGPWSKNNWFGKGNYRDNLYRVLSPYAIAAIFHGHYHASGHYQWGRFEVFNSGSVKNDNRSFLVVQLTDKQLAVAAWNYEYDRWWWWWSKANPGEPGAGLFGQDERKGESRAEFPYPVD